MFQYVLGINKEKNMKINKRIAVRACILKDDFILLIHTNRGDYKFPGGGLEEDESHNDALIREVKEETGYEVSNIGHLIGKITQRNIDIFEPNLIFEMDSYYYLCHVTNQVTNLQLDDYEKELDFQPVWIPLKEAILNNEALMTKIKKNRWLYRDTLVLKELEIYLNH